MIVNSKLPRTDETQITELVRSSLHATQCPRPLLKSPDGGVSIVEHGAGMRTAGMEKGKETKGLGTRDTPCLLCGYRSRDKYLRKQVVKSRVNGTAQTLTRMLANDGAEFPCRAVKGETTTKIRIVGSYSLTVGRENVCRISEALHGWSRTGRFACDGKQQHSSLPRLRPYRGNRREMAMRDLGWISFMPPAAGRREGE